MNGKTCLPCVVCCSILDNISGINCIKKIKFTKCTFSFINILHFLVNNIFILDNIITLLPQIHNSTAKPLVQAHPNASRVQDRAAILLRETGINTLIKNF